MSENVMDVWCAKCGRVTTHQRSSAGELECVRCRVMAAPPTRWCAACNDNTAQDGYGCVACRHRAAERSDAISRRNRRYAMIGIGAGIAVIVAWRVVVAITATSPPPYDPSKYVAQPRKAEIHPAPPQPDPDMAALTDLAAEQPPAIPDVQIRMTNDRDGRESYAAAFGALVLLQFGVTIYCTARGRDLVIRVPGNACVPELLEGIEKAARSGLVQVGFRRVVCDPSGASVAVTR